MKDALKDVGIFFILFTVTSLLVIIFLWAASETEFLRSFIFVAGAVFTFGLFCGFGFFASCQEFYYAWEYSQISKRQNRERLVQEILDS